ncbi:MAG: hypothetical protein IPP93_05740 [Chitinophagaceae bacterium]|nr:hypothetical protein [Chitinophagaceae bacterium]
MEKRILVIVQLQINENLTDQCVAIVKEFVQKTKAHEKDVFEYNWFLNEELNQLFVIQGFYNSGGYLQHLLNLGPHLYKLFDMAPVIRWEIFGNLSETARNALNHISNEHGIKRVINSRIDGFFDFAAKP